MLTPVHRDGGLVHFNRAGGVNPAGPALNKQISIFTDVDGTLVANGKLNQELVSFLRSKKSEGATTVLWSARGEQYAKAVAGQYGVSDLFDSIIGKPTHIIDDQGWRWTQYVRSIVTLEP